MRKHHFSAFGPFLVLQRSEQGRFEPAATHVSVKVSAGPGVLGVKDPAGCFVELAELDSRLATFPSG